MKNPLKAYRSKSLEEKIIINTIISLCFSGILAISKLIVGLFTDYNLITIAIYTIFLLLAKLQCVLGTKSEKISFEKRNTIISILLFFSSLFYIGFMVSSLFIERTIKNNGMLYVLILALISFGEFGFAIAGLIRTKNKGHYYRNIKIINFCIALIAILTTQVAILNMQEEPGFKEQTVPYNAYMGIGVGIFITLCSLFILVAPKVSIVENDHFCFSLIDQDKNHLIDMNNTTYSLILLKSRVYGDYIYDATIKDNFVDGYIKRGVTLWKRMHISLKILCIILSEILIFIYLIGQLVLYFRAITLLKNLKNTFLNNGFKLITSEEIQELKKN